MSNDEQTFFFLNILLYSSKNESFKYFNIIAQLIYNSVTKNSYRYQTIIRLYLDSRQVIPNPATHILTAHFRLDGHPHINPLHKAIQGTNQTYLLFRTNHVSIYLNCNFTILHHSKQSQ